MMDRFLDWVLRTLVFISLLVAGIAIGRHFLSAAPQQNPVAYNRILLVVVDHIDVNARPISALLVDVSSNRPVRLSLIYPVSSAEQAAFAETGISVNPIEFEQKFSIEQTFLNEKPGAEFFTYLHRLGLDWDGYILIDHSTQRNIQTATGIDTGRESQFAQANPDPALVQINTWHNICNASVQIPAGLSLSVLPGIQGHYLSDLPKNSLQIFPNTPLFSFCND